MAQSRRDSSSVRRRSWATFIIPDRRSGLEQAWMITKRLTFMFFALGSSEISVRYFCAIWNLHFYKLTNSRCWRQPKCPGAGPKVSSNGGALRRDWHRAFTRDRERKNLTGGLLTLGKEKAQPSPTGCHCMSSSKAARSIMQATDKGLDVIVSVPLGRRGLASYRRRQQQGRGMTRDEGGRKTIRV